MAMVKCLLIKATREALKADIAKFADVTKYSFNQLETAVNTASESYKNCLQLQENT